MLKKLTELKNPFSSRSESRRPPSWNAALNLIANELLLSSKDELFTNEPYTQEKRKEALKALRYLYELFLKYRENKIDFYTFQYNYINFKLLNASELERIQSFVIARCALEKSMGINISELQKNNQK